MTADGAGSRQTALQALALMVRPSQLLAVTLVYGLGLAMARAAGHTLGTAGVLWGLGALLPVAGAIHLANEYADVATDALTARTPFSGGSGAIARLGVSPRLALGGAWAALATGAFVTGAGLLWGGLVPISAGLLLAGGLLGWMYSLPPRLAWRGWGEVTNAFLGGWLLVLYGYSVAAGRVEGLVTWAALPLALVVFVNLLATQWPDRAADALVGKFSLATRWPVVRLRRSFWLASLLAVGLMALLPLPPAVQLASLVALPLLIWGGRVYTRRHSPLPTVAAMVVLLLAQLAAWWVVGSAG
jgi:1,4-dihydroxy-2-naphthoate octaprenyltransferase